MAKKRKRKGKKKKSKQWDQGVIARAAHQYALEQSKGQHFIKEAYHQAFQWAIDFPDTIPAKFFPGRKKP